MHTKQCLASCAFFIMNKIVAEIPIFITVRGNTKDIFEQNKEALKFSFIYINKANLFNQTYIISDNKDLINYAKELGFINTIFYPCGNDKDIKYLEYLATYRFAVENNYRPDWIILLNIDQIFKFHSLLVDCINNIDDKFDVVASYTEISDRSHFFVDESLNSKESKSCKHKLLSSEHHRVKMVDAAIYAIKTSFAFECMNYDDPSEHFWNGKIKFFENKSIYTNIYNLNDIKKYYKIANIIDKVKEIK